jgi:hypothetical protein
MLAYGMAAKYAQLPAVSAIFKTIGDKIIEQSTPTTTQKDYAATVADLRARGTAEKDIPSLQDFQDKTKVPAGQQNFKYLQDNWKQLGLPDPKSTDPADQATWRSIAEKQLGAAPAQPLVNISGEKKGLDLALTDAQKNYAAIRDGSIPLLQNINDMQDQLDKGVVTGWGPLQHTAEDANTLMYKLGLGGESAPGSANFRSMATRDYAQAAKATFLGGRITNADLQVAQKSQGLDPANPEESLRVMLKVQRAYQEMKIEQHNKDIDRLTSAEPEAGKIANIWRISPDMVPANTAVPTVHTQQEYDKLQSGQTYRDANGHIWQKQ